MPSAFQVTSDDRKDGRHKPRHRAPEARTRASSHPIRPRVDALRPFSSLISIVKDLYRLTILWLKLLQVTMTIKCSNPPRLRKHSEQHTSPG
jgi:hypothetical protein